MFPKIKKILIASLVFASLLSPFSFSEAKKIKPLAATSIPTIYPRTAWSSSSDDKRSKKIWPAEIENPQVIIIHHTATSYKGSTSKQIKKIYRYHSYTKKWGDIGYNYIIGKDGLIFEGRYGGNGVVGGHSYFDGTNYNKGSIGIAVLGNYESEKISLEALDSLEKLTGWLAANNSISISGDLKFHDKKLNAAVIGHRDVASTACPGKKLYADLSQIRATSSDFSAVFSTYGYKVEGDGEVYEINGSRRYSGSVKTNIADISKTQLEAYSRGGAAAGIQAVETTDYPSGTLVKVSEEGKQGVIEDEVMRSISSENIRSTSYNASNFVEISGDKWASYPSGAEAGFRDGAFVEDSGGNYYIFSGGQKRKLVLPEEDLKLVDLSSAHAISDSENAQYAEGPVISQLAGFPVGTLITNNYKSYFFVSIEGRKQKISKNLFRADFSQGMAIKVSGKFLKKYKSNGSLSFQNGSVVKYGKKYYFIENQKKREFQSKDQVTSMGYKNAVSAKRKEMRGIGIGASI